MVHDWATLILMFLVAGHLYLAVLHPATRHALRGMTLGDVDEDWARAHHTKWAGRPKYDAALQPSSLAQLAAPSAPPLKRKQAS